MGKEEEERLNPVLIDKGIRLSKKASEHIHWWSRQRWYSVIMIIPDLREGDPLWSRTDESLSHIRLFGLTPEQLERNIERYHNNPAWRRFFQRLFSSIEEQFEAWTYYQKCLSFREVQQREWRATSTDVMLYMPSERLMGKLAPWLDQLDRQFERAIHRRSADWVKQYFETALADHETQRRKSFLVRLKKELQGLSSETDREETQKEVEAAYQKLHEMLRAYFLQWWKGTYVVKSPSVVTENRVVSVARPSTMACASVSPPCRAAVDTEFSASKAVAFAQAQRASIMKCIEAEEKRSLMEVKVCSLLQAGLRQLMDFVRPQIRRYQVLIEKGLLGKVPCQAALEMTEVLQSNLVICYRQGLFLFHPDHYQALWEKSPVLMSYWNQIFSKYKEYWEGNLEILAEGQKRLKDDIQHHFELDQSTQALCDAYERINQTLRETIQQREDDIQHHDVLCEVMKGRLGKINQTIEARARVLEEQDTKLQEQDTKLQGQDTKLQTQEEKIKELAEEARIENERFKQEIAQLFRLVSGRRPSQEGAAGEERPRFFKP